MRSRGGLAECFFAQQQIFASCAGARDVDCRESSAVNQAAVKDDFAVTRAFELLKNNVVHFAAGVDESGADDGQAAAFFDVSRGGEKATGLM